MAFYCRVVFHCTTFCLSAPQAMDVWIVSNFWLLSLMPLWPLVYIQLCVWMCVGIFLQLNFSCRAWWEAREGLISKLFCSASRLSDAVLGSGDPPLTRQHRFSTGAGREPRALLATQLSSPSYWEELPCLQHGQFRVKERFDDLKSWSFS